MLRIHLKCSSNDSWVLRKSLQTYIVNHVQRTSGFTEYHVYPIFITFSIHR